MAPRLLWSDDPEMLSCHARRALATLLLVPSAAQAPAVPFAAAQQDLAAVIRAELARCELPALSIAVVDGGRTLWSAGFGKDPRSGVDVSGATPYRVASISKLFTATAIMRLVERGALDLDADVAKLAPGVRPRGFVEQPISLRGLLSHTAGIVREPSIGHYFDLTPPPLAEVVAGLHETELVAAPGTLFKYSNAGVTWAGQALAVKLRRPFTDVVTSEVLQPSGLEHATFLGNERDDVVQGPMWTYDGRAIPTPRVDLGLGPAANLCASMDDLVRFAQSWFLGEHRQPHALLTEASLRQMFTPTPNFPRIGVGFFLDRLDGHLLVGHDGAYYGVASRVSALPELGIAVAVAVPVDFASGPVDRVAERALRWALAARRGERLPASRTPRPLGAALARQLAGTYARRLDEREWSSERVEILAWGEHAWLRPRAGVWQRLEQLDAQPDAQPDDPPDAGQLWVADRMTDNQPVPFRAGALELGGQRLEPVPVPPEPCPAHLQPWLGEYGWDHDVLLVLERDGQLAVLIEWVAEYPLLPVDAAAGRFRLDPNSGMYRGEQVTFSRDAEGKVTGVRVGAVDFPRRALLGVDGGAFRIAPRQPLERLRELAAQARAPQPPPGARAFDLVELREAVPGIRYDIRYAGTDNFLGAQVYDAAEAKLQRPAAEALARVQAKLAARGYGLLVHDAFRPWRVTKIFWDATPDAQRHFVANPERGSRHNRGCAIDLTLCDLPTGAPVEMPSLYDEFTPRAYPLYPGGTSRQRWHRELLRAAMEAEGFAVYEHEWWHFDYRDWAAYPVR